MPNDTPDDGIGGSLTLEEAANAYANPGTDEETGDGHAEPEQDAEDEAPEDTAEAEEAEGETDDEGQAEDEQQEEPAAPAYAAPEAKVKLPDGEEMTVADLIKGNLRDRDYRQKTMASAERERAVAAKSEEVKQFEQQLSADREFVIELVQSIMPAKPDHNMVSVDPLGYAEAKAQYDARKEQIDYLLSVKQHLAQKAAAEQEETVRETRQREWQATLEKLPELKDSTRLTSFVSEIQQHGAEYGYSPQELQQVGMDHRQVVVLKDAIAWRKLQASKSKAQAKVEGRPPVQRGGTRQSPQTQTARDARVAMDRLKSSGSIRDGVAALLAIEKG